MLEINELWGEEYSLGISGDSGWSCDAATETCVSAGGTDEKVSSTCPRSALFMMGWLLSSTKIAKYKIRLIENMIKKWFPRFWTSAGPNFTTPSWNSFKYFSIEDLNRDIGWQPNVYFFFFYPQLKIEKWKPKTKNHFAKRLSFWLRLANTVVNMQRRIEGRIVEKWRFVSARNEVSYVYPQWIELRKCLIVLKRFSKHPFNLQVLQNFWVKLSYRCPQSCYV